MKKEKEKEREREEDKISLGRRERERVPYSLFSVEWFLLSGHGFAAGAAVEQFSSFAGVWHSLRRFS